jgi:CDP-paratose 2-epimerase
LGADVIGVDNNLRRYFFGPGGDTSSMQNTLKATLKSYRHEDCDIRDRGRVFGLFREFTPDLVVHAAAQPSHDWAAKEPFTDFEVNAVGTLNLLEAFRQHAPKGVFCLMSTNKVYGDAPNHLPLEELEKRYDYQAPLRGKGIDERLSIDGCLHSLFGASKASADLVAQEYGRYFGLNVGIFRGGCLTGSRHAGVRLHGFLSFLIDCALRGETYEIYGYRGKQVRDQIHSSDVVRAIDAFRQAPRKGEVYNLGGGYANSASILEVIDRIEKNFGLKLKTKYVDRARIGDHICYYTDMGKFFAHYPQYRLQKSLDTILREMVEDATRKTVKAA